MNITSGRVLGHAPPENLEKYKPCYLVVITGSNFKYSMLKISERKSTPKCQPVNFPCCQIFYLNLLTSILTPSFLRAANIFNPSSVDAIDMVR